jgi:hypothetical protein
VQDLSIVKGQMTNINLVLPPFCNNSTTNMDRREYDLGGIMYTSALRYSVTVQVLNVDLHWSIWFFDLQIEQRKYTYFKGFRLEIFFHHPIRLS